jgi:hypothetical protein
MIIFLRPNPVRLLAMMPGELFVFQQTASLACLHYAAKTRVKPG